MTILTSATIPLKNKSLLQYSNNIDPLLSLKVLDNFSTYTVKKVSDFPVPSRDVTSQTLSGREWFTGFERCCQSKKDAKCYVETTLAKLEGSDGIAQRLILKVQKPVKVPFQN